MKYDLVAIGNPVYDLITTPRTTTRERILSGCSTNACLAAKRLGMRRVMLVGNVGSDFRERFQSEMRRYEIEAINTASGGKTTGFSLKYDEKGDRTLKVIADAGKIPIKDVWSECSDARYLLLGPVLSEIEIDAAIELMKSSDAQTFLDPQGLLRRRDAEDQIEHFCDREKFAELVSSIDFVKPNELEAEVITRLRDPSASAKELLRWGTRAAIVTLGENGSVACEGRRCLTIPAYRTTAIDPTGAGDVYGGAFLAEYSRTEELGRSCLYASAAASIMVENVGPDFPVTDESVRKRAKLMSTEFETLNGSLEGV